MGSYKSIPSKKMERIKVRVLTDIPVFEELQPEIGNVYDAINGERVSKARGTPSEYCIIEVAGKKIVLRNKHGFENEYEVVADGRT